MPCTARSPPDASHTFDAPCSTAVADFGTPTCVVQPFDRTLSTFGNYTGLEDDEFVVEIVDDTSVPNTYRYKKGVNGTFSEAFDCNSTFHPPYGCV